MLESLHLKDFQSHVNTKIEFDQLFNIIVGPSGSGKSAIIRALKYTAFNNAGSGEVRCPDAKSYVIDLCINGTHVTREKGEGVNSYTVADKEFVDVNRDVPNSVSDILNIRKVELDPAYDLVVQFADQMDAPFMLSEKDSIKMKFLNTLSGTNAVDLAAKEAVQLVKENNKYKKDADENLKVLLAKKVELEQELEKIKTVNKYLKNKTQELRDLKEQVKPLQDVKAKSDYLFDAYRKIRIIQRVYEDIDLVSITTCIDRLIMLKTLETRYIDFLKRYTRIANIKKLVETINIEKTLNNINTLDRLLVLNKKRAVVHKRYVELKDIESIISSVDTKMLQGKIDTYNKLCMVIEKRNKLKEEMKNIKNRSLELETQYNVELDNYKNTLREVGVCPVCGNILTKECLDKMLQV